MRQSRCIPVALFGLSLALCVGCARTTPSRFYLLSPTPPADVTLVAERLVVGVGPVELASYLDRPQLVTRTGAHEIELSEFHRWAEPLQENVASVLVANLSQLLGTDEVLTYPWSRRVTPDWRVAVTITQLERTSEGAAVLAATWSVAPDGGDAQLTQRFRTELPCDGAGCQTAVAALSNALGDLSRAIAAAIRE